MLRELKLISDGEDSELKYLIEIPWNDLQLREDEIVKMFLNRMDPRYTEKHTSSWTCNSFVHMEPGKTEHYKFRIDKIDPGLLTRVFTGERRVF